MADVITVLRDGRKIGTVDADDATQNELAEMMVGREVMLEVDKEPTQTGDVVLGVEDLRVTDNRDLERVQGVSFSVRKGEIFGIAGVDGNGQSEMVEAIAGLRTPTDGRVVYEGADIAGLSRRERIENGISYIPEDRQERGLIMDFDVVENTILGSQHAPQFSGTGRINWGFTRNHSNDIVDEYDVRTPNVDVDAHSLSGGNQQKFIVGRELMRNPTLVIASHPTRGVDVGSIEFIHDRLLDLRDEDKSVLLVSSSLDEVRQLSDRLAVIYEGEFMDIVDPDQITEEQLGLLMAGEEPDTTPSIDDDVEWSGGTSA